MRFFKYHAIGNDYVVLEAAPTETNALAELARRVCDRHFGLGADGILVLTEAPGGAEFGLRIFNPDGSEAEKSGNGLRIFSRYLWDVKKVDGEPFEIWTRGGLVKCQVDFRKRDASVEMGRISFDSREIPVVGPPREVLNEGMAFGDEKLIVSAATVGNPHCIVMRDYISEQETRRLGPLIETDARFPNRTNVQFVRVVDRNHLQIQIWERGAGYTLSSGTSSCAAAGVARRLGLCDEEIDVQMPGGSLKIHIDIDFFVRISGPVTRVADGTLSGEILNP